MPDMGRVGERLDMPDSAHRPGVWRRRSGRPVIPYLFLSLSLSRLLLNLSTAGLVRLYVDIDGQNPIHLMVQSRLPYWPLREAGSILAILSFVLSGRIEPLGDRPTIAMGKLT